MLKGNDMNKEEQEEELMLYVKEEYMDNNNFKFDIKDYVLSRLWEFQTYK